MTVKSGKSFYLQAVTIIDPATGWIEICTAPSAQADLVANQAELAWLTSHLLPSKVIVNRGNEFLAQFREIIINDYSIKVKPITSRNLQANTILERVHQIIGNDEIPLDSIIASTLFALRATINTTTQYTPVQLVFGHN